MSNRADVHDTGAEHQISVLTAGLLIEVNPFRTCSDTFG